MREGHDPRWTPFAIAAAALVVVSIAVFRLPQAFVADMQRDGLLTGDSATVAFVFLATMALAQAAYAGFIILRPERIEGLLASEPPVASERRPGVMGTVARNAAGIASLTLVYGVATFALTGLRGGFWWFIAVELAQGAWYYRQVGLIERTFSERKKTAVA